MSPSDRRRFLRLLASAPFLLGGVAQGACFDEAAAAEALLAASSPVRGVARRLAPTPECGDDDEPTPRQTEGPFFTPSSPKRDSLLEPGMKGTRIVLSGRVFARDCRPVSGALLDFWHADDDGEYDNEGYRLRGHQFTDEEGRYQLETIVAGVYPGRTRHYHVRLQAPHGKVLTTQLYFPDEARNRRDFLFRPELLMAVKSGSGQGRFHFMLDQA